MSTYADEYAWGVGYGLELAEHHVVERYEIRTRLRHKPNLTARQRGVLAALEAARMVRGPEEVQNSIAVAVPYEEFDSLPGHLVALRAWEQVWADHPILGDRPPNRVYDDQLTLARYYIWEWAIQS